MATKDSVPRPPRKSDYAIVFLTRHASTGWHDLVAVRRNAVVDAWETLTTAPLERTLLNGPLQGSLALVVRDGESHERWQLKLNSRDGARIWFFVVGREVRLERVFTGHPNETK